jgi:hypothetical protein
MIVAESFALTLCGRVWSAAESRTVVWTPLPESMGALAFASGSMRRDEMRRRGAAAEKRTMRMMHSVNEECVTFRATADVYYKGTELVCIPRARGVQELLLPLLRLLAHDSTAQRVLVT